MCVCVCVCVLQSQPVESAGTQVLVLGLDGAGKTSLLHCLATGSLEQDMQPTQGFNAVSINKEDLHIEFLESESELLFTSEHTHHRKQMSVMGLC